MSLPIPPEFKAAKPFLQRAEELDRDPSQEASVTAYYCRQRAMELGIALRDTAQDPAAATTFLLSLMDTLEAKKQALGDLNREEGEQVVCQFAEDVFGKADAEDRSGRASKATARTFYAASIFFDALTQFGERGEEVEEKCRYAKYKATDIMKCLREGRRPEPGPPGSEPTTLDIPDATVLPLPSLPPPYSDLPPAGKPSAPSPPRAPASLQQAPPAFAPPPIRAWAPQPPQQLPSYTGRQPSPSQFADAIECCRFAIAACDAKDAGLALERLKRAFEALS
jgi:vacuolar protein sorting-associated protein VTA1